MANSSHSDRWPRFLAPLVLGLLGVAAAAQNPREAQKIVVDARPVEIDTQKNTALLRDVVITQGDLRISANEARVVGGLKFETGEWTIEGDVRIVAEGGNLQSDKAVVAFRDNVISQATITGSPAVFEQLRADGNTARGRANTIDYVTASGTVSLRDKAWLTPDGCNEITGNSLVYNIKTQSVQSQPSAGGDGRIRITIQPKNGSGAPCNRTAPGRKP